MKVLYVAVEVAPFAKVGGLADVAGSLPKALKERGLDTRIVMPAYGMCVEGLKPFLTAIPVRVRPDWCPLMNVYEVQHDGVTHYMIESPGTFETTLKSEELYQYGRDTYIFFAAAVLAMCEAIDWIPDIIHANDWHTGFLPVLLREKSHTCFGKTASVFTIHNLAYQGTFGQETLEAASLSPDLFTADKLETFGGVNFIKSGCVYADVVNTVSPTYAHEIQEPEYGAGLWGVMRDLHQKEKLFGILNGIDQDFFNPETDKFIAKNFNKSDISGKAECKAALQHELGLMVDKDIPVIGIVSRLSDQKGYDLILEQAFGMLALGAQFVSLGTGDPWAAGQLRKLQAEWPDQVHFIERYDAPLAQRIYAGSDMFLMPSAYEPCGLGQMIALRYGTLPIVRKTGGLADSIFEPKNGFVFEQRTAKVLFDTIKRAIEAFENKSEWEAQVKRALIEDFSWTKSAELYEDMYKSALNRRISAGNGLQRTV